jgi:hypothetical protein
MPNLALPGYPVSLANRMFGVFDYTGPASYITGGDQITASDFGMSTIDFVLAAQLSLSGSYQFLVLYPTLGSLNVGAVTIAWYLYAGAQVSPGTNLAGEHTHLMVWGI